MVCTKEKGGSGSAAIKDNAKMEILKVMAGSAVACGCKEIAAASGIDGETVSSKLKVLKIEGYVDSPVRCKYAITAAGRMAVGV